MIIKLRSYRRSKDLTQEVLAYKLSISRQSVIAIEQGKFVPSTLLALKMAKILNTSIEELFILEEKDWK